MIQQGHIFSFLPTFVLNNHKSEILPTNQIASANCSSLIGRYLKERKAYKDKCRNKGS